MNQKTKLLKRFRRKPKDFTFDELTSLFKQYGFVLKSKGITSGSRIEFYNEESDKCFEMHKPHPSKTVKGYIIKKVADFLEELDSTK